MADRIHHRPPHVSHNSDISFDRKSSLELGGTAALPELAGLPGLAGDLHRTEALAGRRESMGFEDNEAGLPPVDRGRDAWLFVLNGFVIDAVIWGAGGSWGTFQLYLSTHAPFDKSSLSAIGIVGTVSLGLFFILPLPFVFVSRQYPHHLRKALFAALFVYILQFLLSSWATAVWQLILLQGVLGGVSGAVLYIPVLNFVQEWWLVRRGTASGLISFGSAVAGVGYPLMISALLDKWGFAWVMRFWALVCAVTLTPAVYFVRPRLPPVKPVAGGPGAPKRIDLSFLTNRTTLPLIMSCFTYSLGWFSTSIYLSTYTANVGSDFAGNGALALLNGGWAVGGILTGYVSDRMGWSYLLALLGAGECLAALASWSTADTLAKALAFATLYGFLGGQVNAYPAAARDLSTHNVANAAVVVSFCFAVRGVACIVGPLIAARLYEGGGVAGWGYFGYGKLQIWVAVMAAGSALSALAIALVKPSSRRKQD